MKIKNLKKTAIRNLIKEMNIVLEEWGKAASYAIHR